MPSFSRNLEETLHRAVAFANQRKHEYATPEHLLLALVDDQDAAAVMNACDVDMGALKKIAGSFDLLLSTVNADQDWQAFINSLRPKGTLCVVGVPPSPIAIQASSLIGQQRSISGSPTGSPQDLYAMLDVAARHGVKAITERFPMAKANEAIARAKKSKVRYRAVLAN